MGEPSKTTSPASIVHAVLSKWKIILAGTVASGLLGLMVTPILPKVYTSEALIQVADRPGAVEVLLRSPVVIDRVLQNLGIKPAEIADRRDQLRNTMRIASISGSDRKPTGYFRLEVDATDPAESLKTAETLIAVWIQATKPGQARSMALSGQIKRLEAELSEINVLMKRLQSESSTLIAPPLQVELATPLAALAERRAKYVDTIEALNNELSGLSADVVVSPPSVRPPPRHREAPNIGALLALGTFLILTAGIAAKSALSG